MKKTNWLRTLLCLCLALGTVLSLCACPGSTPPEGGGTTTPPDDGGTTPGGDGGTGDGGTGDGGAGDGGTGDGGSTTPPEDKPTPDLYGDGAHIAGAGATLASGSFAAKAPSYDASNPTEVRPNSFFRTTKKEAGRAYITNGTKAVTIDEAGEYDGGSSILIAPNGVVIENAEGVTLKNITIIGTLTVKGSASLTLEKVAVINNEGTALSVDAASAGLRMNDCRLTGKTALSLAASESAILNSYLSFTEAGILDTAAAGTNVIGCVLEGSGTGITSAASESAFRSNTLKMGAADTGIQLESGILNGLVALNVVTGAQKSITVSGVKNVSLVLNTAVSIEASHNSNLYICDNSLGGRLTASNNNYIIADGNKTPDDGYNHETVGTGNQNQNGDSLMDVTARPEVGADEALLPHVDEDLFVGMERKDTVCDPLSSEAYNLASYILEHAKTDRYVIVAPGAYKNAGAVSFRAEHSDTKLYAYGVYMERQTGFGTMLDFRGAERITVKGLTVGSKQQSCGQVYVLEKLGNTQLKVVTGAGMINDFGNSTAGKFDLNAGMGPIRAGTDFAYCDTTYKSVRKESDGTMTITVDPSVGSMIKKGDILTCRFAGAGHSINLGGTKDIVFYDFNLFGNTGGFAFLESGNLTATTYYRVYNSPRSGEIIDEATYNKYLELEKRYGVDLEVSKEYIGDVARYRGSPAHIGSLDATHTSDCAEGSQATFCVFENMCDDATNQNHYAARLHSVVDNGETVTITYKGVLTLQNYRGGNYTNFNFLCTDFKPGDRVYIYTANGQLICDTQALSATTRLSNMSISSYGQSASVPMRTVTIASIALSEKARAALAQYDLTLNTVDDDKKVLIDNMSMASNGFKFDNCKFQNIRSRGLLIKASEGAIQNCTFRNIGGACAAVYYEINWGESGVTENMLIDRNLIDNTGFFAATNFSSNDRYESSMNSHAPISIAGLGSSVDEDFLLYRNITISNNRIVNRTTKYAIYVNSAKDINIVNNYFGEFTGNDFAVKPEAGESAANPMPVIRINGAMNIKIEGNRYPETGFVQDQIVASKNKNVFGADVVHNGLALIPDSE